MLKKRLWQLAIGVGLAIHLAGAFTALPIIKEMPDFAAYYVAAWGAHAGLAVYDWPKTVETAVASGVPMAASALGLPVDYPPLFILLLIPFSLLPYAVAQIIWGLILVLISVASAYLLTRIFRRPFWLMFIALVSFSPFTLGLAYGNISPLLLLGVLVLVASLDLNKIRTLWFYLPFALVSTIKLFPLAWIFVLVAGKRWGNLKKVLLWIGIIACATIIISPQLTSGFVNNLHDAGDSPLTGRPSNSIGNQQTNVLGFITQVTQPIVINYSRYGLSRSDKVIMPFMPLSAGNMQIIAWGIIILLGILLSAMTLRLILRGYSFQALFFFVTGVLLIQPFTLYHYLIILLPSFIYLLQSKNTKISWLAIIAFIILGISRFVGLLTAIVPASLFVLAAQLGTIAMLLVEIGIYWSARQPHMPGDAVLPANDLRV